MSTWESSVKFSNDDERWHSPLLERNAHLDERSTPAVFVGDSSSPTIVKKCGNLGFLLASIKPERVTLTLKAQ